MSYEIGIVEEFIVERIENEETKKDKIYCINEIRRLLERIEDGINGGQK